MELLPVSGCHEPVSSLSHLLGAVVFLRLAWTILQRSRGDWLRTASLAVMAVCTVQLLILSGLYHLFPPGALREAFQFADVAAIFLMIAGSLTPVHIILFQGFGRWAPVAMLWLAAGGGIGFRWLYGDTITTRGGIAIFLVFGWGAVITAAILWQRHGWRFVQNGVLSGLTYTLGAVMLAAHQPTLVPGVIGPHELWHAAVLCALGLYWRFAFQIASGEIPALVMPVPILRMPSTGEPRLVEDSANERRAA